MRAKQEPINDTWRSQDTHMSMPQTPEQMKAFNRQLIADFRAHDPRFSGRKIVLLTTTGAHSGQPHTAPMTYVTDGDRVLVIASNAGAVKASRLVLQPRRQSRRHGRATGRDVSGACGHRRGRGVRPPVGADRGADALLHRPPGKDQPPDSHRYPGAGGIRGMTPMGRSGGRAASACPFDWNRFLSTI